MRKELSLVEWVSEVVHSRSEESLVLLRSFNAMTFTGVTQPPQQTDANSYHQPTPYHITHTHFLGGAFCAPLSQLH